MQEQTEQPSKNELTIDDKLDKIMEAVAFQSKILVSTLLAMDKLMGSKESKIIKPVL